MTPDPYAALDAEEARLLAELAEVRSAKATLRRVLGLADPPHGPVGLPAEEPPPAAPAKRPKAVGTRAEPVIPGAPAARALPRAAGEPTDDQLDAACDRPAPKGPLEMLKAMAAHCGPRDLAETILEAVRANPSPAVVAAHLLDMLGPVARRQERRPAG